MKTKKELIKDFRKLLDKLGFIPTPAPNAKKHTKELRKTLEQFLLDALSQQRKELEEQISEWADNNTSRSIDFFNKDQDSPMIEERQKSAKSLVSFLDSLKSEGVKK